MTKNVLEYCRWAVGVLMYFMLQTELPFGSWRDNEVEIFGRIARRQLTFPSTFSPEARDLIDKVNLAYSFHLWTSDPTMHLFTVPFELVHRALCFIVF